ncbi:flagellar filament capping protein FliD [Treponema parvum]|uniref:Flagellar hook-associated protein 2 n=1 Tax=Treponema parvum TaxID=138851 RepID=A0A975IEU2_9SPIR|nr:flagellar filament capping protein FliD [Treponema parvum]QTQ14187.1 flagellar filament capping protein FliD [Treponema parvum]
MAGINIPGISDQYKTNDLVESLMKVERIPLTREKENLDNYKEQQSAWRSVNSDMSSLRSSVKSLYSFDNPFNNKLTSSTDEYAVTATANRDAEYESFKIDVIAPATADRFMSSEIAKDYIVPGGKYTFTVNDKKISFKWNGGKISDFVSSLNKRGNSVIKADTVGMNNGKISLLIESLKTGAVNHLEFNDDALKFAKSVNIIGPVKPEATLFGKQNNELKDVGTLNVPLEEQEGLPDISNKKVYAGEKGTTVPPRSGFSVELPQKFKADSVIAFTVETTPVVDVTIEINENLSRPSLPDAGEAEFQGITVQNEPSETALPSPEFKGPIEPVENRNFVYVRLADGTERLADKISLSTDENTGLLSVSLNSADYQGVEAIVIRNRNTGQELIVSPFSVYERKTASGFAPLNAVSTAGDAEIKYEGITIRRAENSIDDVVPNVTLNIKNPTKETAIITVKPDKDAAKNALIEFVGKYNKTIADINILSQNKPEIIDELEYLTDSEKEEKQKRLGLFFSDFSLANVKNQLQTIISSQYRYSETAEITMLDQIGISTNAAGGATGYSPGRLRGYLEIDEKKLDNNIENNLESIKSIFGYDTDGDLIVDSGIGYALDRQLTAYVQSGGILANKTSSLDRQIKSSETKIARLETQLNAKESELKQKYGQMESSLNSLENQQRSISNFSNSMNKNRSQ